MKRFALVMMVVVVLAVCVAGCTSDFPLKWKPTEQQKQAADLTVKDLQALHPYVAPEAEPLRVEAHRSAEITQTYIGLPKDRPQPISPQNQPMLQQAAQDANRPPPTVGQVGTAVVDQAAKITETGFDLTEVILAAVGTIAGTWGFGKVKSRVDGWRDGAASAEAQVNETMRALQEVVQSIDHLDPETKAKVKAAQQQSLETQQLVSEAKRS